MPESSRPRLPADPELDDSAAFGPAARRIDSVEARYEANKIAFGPVVFQGARLLRDLGLLAAMEAAGPDGIGIDALAERAGISPYGATVLCEVGLSAGLCRLEGGRYRIAKVGMVLLHDELTRRNLDFIHDVCYQGLFHLEAAIREGRPAGLPELGPWRTIYEGLTKLPDAARASWFGFDHFYSDSAFAAALDLVLSHRPRRIMDVGANTGRFTLSVLGRDPEAHVTLVDLPPQLEVARRAVREAGHEARITTVAADLIDDAAVLPGPQDAVWMSQFLVCFSPPQVQSILARAAAALAPGGSVFVLDNFWDQQEFEHGAYCLINTSPYFTVMANGNSRMYRLRDIERAAAAVGLALRERSGTLGINHHLLRFQRA